MTTTSKSAQFGDSEKCPLLMGTTVSSSSTSPVIIEGQNEDTLPSEILKTLIAGFVYLVALFLNSVFLVLAHQRLPDRNATKPLPDILLDTLPIWDAGSSYADIILLWCSITTYGFILFHRYRWIVFRRIFFIFSILYLLRCFTMYVTVLPVSSCTRYCSPKFTPATLGNVLKAASNVFFGFGLTITGGHTFCGDYIYSGHTVTLVTLALFVQEYSPSGLWIWKIIHGFYWMAAVVGVFLILLARGHYTIDVLIAYYITTRLFWIYHTLVNTKENLTENGFIRRVWWLKAFNWCEGNVKGRVPHHYSFPIPSAKYYADFENNPIRIVKTTQ